MINSHPLTSVRAGFIPLVDCAALVVAREKGFATANGIDLQLSKEASWANIRDRINVGQFDVAHMLAGMPIAANLGIGQVKVPMIAPMALSVGGNAITLSNAAFDALSQTGYDLNDAMSAAKALRHVVEGRRKQDLSPLTFGMVFPFSNHNYQLRYWMAAAGINPDRDVRLVVIPPPYMVQSLRSGQIDGFCVGEPWNTLSVDQSVGRILLSGADIWPHGPEKVLGMQKSWAENNPDTLAALLCALDQAAHWADESAHRDELASLLARPEYLGVSSALIVNALQGDLCFSAKQNVIAAQEHALWLYAQMVRWGQTHISSAAEQAVCEAYRPDLLSDALCEDMPEGAPENAHGTSNLTHLPLDGATFNPDNVAEYITATPIKVIKI